MVIVRDWCCRDDIEASDMKHELQSECSTVEIRLGLDFGFARFAESD